MQERGIDSGTSFNEARDNIEQFYMLRGLVKEFFETQKRFHDNMHKLVMTCLDVSIQLSDDEQEKLEKILKPFCILIANPFAETATGNLQTDIAHILGVVNARNDHFQKALPALMMAAANMHQFNELLASIHAKPDLTKAMCQGMAVSSWQLVESAAALPIQHIARYNLLLNAIEKEVTKAGLPETSEIVKNIMNVIAFIIPELKYIDSNSSNLININKIDAILSRIARMPNSENFVTSEEKAVGLTFANKLSAVKLQLSSAMVAIARGDGDALTSLEGVMQMLQMLESGTRAAIELEKKSYYLWAKQGAQSWSETLFGDYNPLYKLESDPREELSLEIKRLKGVCDGLDFMRDKGVNYKA